MTVPLVVGMPCHRRHRVLDDWFDSLAAQDAPDGTRLIFLLSEPGDPSERVILRRAPDAEILYDEGLPALGDEGREDPRRHVVLATLRNRLLRAVGSLAPEHYLSWDSDIVLRPGALGEMLRLGKDAVGALVDMGGDAHPGDWSWMRFDPMDPHWAYRPQVSVPVVPMPVDVIMGVKLLSQAAYSNVRYADHLLGEDVGWAIQAQAMGVERWICPAAWGLHLYSAPTPPEEVSPGG